jgi:formate dehydrogenase major subunit
MAATGWPQAYAGPVDILDEIARVAPPFAGLSYPRLDAGGLQWPVPDRMHSGTAVLHRDGFPRGRGRFACVAPIPSPALAVSRDDYPLLLTTGRRLEHYNAGSMTGRGVDGTSGYDELELATVDAARFGVASGQRVEVTSPWGTAHAVVALSPRVAVGTAFLSFHGAATGTNRLISPVLDRFTGCPEYKVTPVRVRPTGAHVLLRP